MTGWKLRPARDLHLAPGARLRSHLRETGLAGVAAGTLWRAATRGYLALAHRLEITGREHLPPEPPCVLVANHTSHLDALCLGAALPGRLARRAVALADGDVFFGTAAGAAFAATALNALPIWRGRTSPEDLALLRTRLVEDALVFVLFPEGTRARDGVMARFRPGLGAFVAGTPVPVVPCHLEGAFACWPASRAWPRPGRLRLRIGPPMTFGEVANDRAGALEIAAATERAVRELAAAT